MQGEILAEGALDGFNEEARHLVYLIADTGLRLSEAANLTTETIHLDHEIPNIVLKTSIPLDLLIGTYRTSKLRVPCFRIARRFGRHLQTIDCDKRSFWRCHLGYDELQKAQDCLAGHRFRPTARPLISHNFTFQTETKVGPELTAETLA
ncbi:hypothetical protein [Mesorhizobium escarrei]|uniref:Tyr recombinase domain-containing protein n=1 Tax=Mesorhizobium escarrei TaxID=666018 RepID=A0ABM9DNL2_9HYPH|nr:hypothetical protein [Mesorhizobium escarrei]CAH2398228.1 conserved hypothetical protein [Mesorhizobium escarrei]